jgi:GNAT superfamily N-acetyltransferase
MWRDAIASDDDAIVALVRALYDEDPSPVPVPDSHARATLARLRAEPTRGRAVVLELDGKLRGYAFLISFWSNELGGEVCEIDELYVAGDARGQGHSTRLLDGLATRTLPWFRDAVAFALEVTADNARARRLYERLGFKAHNQSFVRRR